MIHALRLDARSNGADRTAISVPRSRYTVVGKLRASGRAELSICLPRGAHRVDDVVLVKTFAAGVLERAGDGELPSEIELCSRLHHDNIVRTLGCGSDEGKDFIVSEYLEGITLRRLLEWLHTHGEKLADAAVVRVLLGVFAAVEHATRCAITPAARALVHQVVAAEDVFITCKGDVKLLAFKPSSRFDGAADESPLIDRAAVDALLATQRSPELSLVLARVGARLAPSSVLGLWQIARALESWQEQELGSDGRAELAAMMAKLLPEGRATRRAHLEAACARVRRLQLAREEGAAPASEAPRVEASGEAAEEAPPVSGFRTTGVDVASVRPPLDSEPPDVEPSFSPFAPAARELSVRSEASLPVRVEPSAPLDLPPRPSASHRPLAIDITAPEAAGVRLPWLAVAIAAGAVAAFGVHHLVRAPRAPLAVAAPGAELTPPPPAPAVVPAVAAERAESPPAATDVPPGESPAQPGLRSTAGRWKLPAEARSGVERQNERASIAPVMARGYLTLDTTPWSMVSLGGVALGQTPLVKIELPAGQHVLSLANPELGIASSVVVDVVAGVTMVRRIGLERPAAQAVAN
jgi:serine/threonine-protein kinase